MGEITDGLPGLGHRAKSWLKKNEKSLRRIRQNRSLTSVFQEAHVETFSRTDCLQCANCCKTTGPLFTTKDIDRLASHLKLSGPAFIHQYLRKDEDGDWVLQQVPCPFLEDNNECRIYDVRPKACREYPHTDHPHQSRIFDLTLKNAGICPAVLDILQKVTEKIESDQPRRKK
jgi:uncharacterized protein